MYLLRKFSRPVRLNMYSRGFADKRFATQTPYYPTWCHFCKEILAHHIESGVSLKKQATATTNNQLWMCLNFSSQVLIGIFKSWISWLMSRNTRYNINQMFGCLKYKSKLIIFHPGMSDDALLLHSNKWPWKLAKCPSVAKTAIVDGG